MLVIAGSERDAQALAAIEYLASKGAAGRCAGAALLGASDLSKPGWALRPTLASRDSDTIVAGGRTIRTSQISCLLVRRLAVYPQELLHVDEPDRDYAAAEMTAILQWWLHSVPIPVLNRPGPNLLCGPGWRPEQWRHKAAELGIPVAGQWRRSVFSEWEGAPAATEVIVLRGRAMSDANPELEFAATALAEAAGTGLLQILFDTEGRFMSANPMPPLTPPLLDAISEGAA